MTLMNNNMLEFIRKNHIAALSTVDESGMPNVSPKGFTFYDGETLIYVDIYSERTLNNIKTNPKVAICIWDNKAVNGYQFKGIAEILEGGPIYDEIIEKYRHAHLKNITNIPQDMKVVMIKVKEIYSVRPEDKGKRLA